LGCLLLLFTCSFLLASRTLMLVLYLSTLFFLIYLIIHRKKYLEGMVMIIGLSLGLFFAFKFFPSTFNRFRELAYSQFRYDNNGPESHYNMEVTADQWNGANLRKALWQCGWQCFLEKPLTGVTIGDKQARLNSIYEEKNFQFALKTHRNVHNNYLDILLGTGLIGLLLFLVSWIFGPAWTFLKEKDWLALLMLGTIAIAMITENYFDRSLGGMMVAFFIPFLLTASGTSTSQRTK
jgi:O-antigen ligase